MSDVTDRNATKDWLEDILEGHYSRIHPEAEAELHVDDWEINPVDGENYLSEILALDVKYTAGKESKRETLIAKLLPQNSLNRAFVIETQFDLREIKFYTEIRPTLEEVVENRLGLRTYILPSPNCFHAVHKDDSESILVMENLTTRGFKQQDLTAGLTLSQVEAAIESLVHIHSSAIVYQKEEKVELRQRFPYLLTSAKAIEAFQSLFEKGLPLLLKFLQKRQDFISIRSKLQVYDENRSRDVFHKVLQPSTKLNTLTHCDYWCDNLLFKEIEGKTTCSVIDWQMVMNGRVSIDLGMLIATSLSPEMRRNHSDALVKTYWKELLKRLEQMGIKEKELGYSFEDLQSDVKNSTLFSALLMIGSIDMALGTPKREDRVLCLLEDLLTAGIL